MEKDITTNQNNEQQIEEFEENLTVEQKVSILQQKLTNILNAVSEDIVEFVELRPILSDEDKDNLLGVLYTYNRFKQEEISNQKSENIKLIFLLSESKTEGVFIKHKIFDDIKPVSQHDDPDAFFSANLRVLETHEDRVLYEQVIMLIVSLVKTGFEFKFIPFTEYLRRTEMEEETKEKQNGATYPFILAYDEAKDIYIEMLIK